MNTPLDADLDAFLRHGQAHGWTERTVTHYRQRMTPVVRFLRGCGCRRSADVTPGDLDALMQAELSRGQAKSSRIGLAILVRRFFRWMHEQGRIMRDPARSLPVPHGGEGDLPEMPLSEGEVRALLAGLPRRSIAGLRNACILELLYGCGLRRSEAVGLNVADVDLSQRTLWVHGKGGQDRMLPLMGTATAMVRDWLAVRRTFLRGPDHGALFLSKEGKRLENHSIDALFRVLNAKRGPSAQRLHPHLLRHSIAVHLLRGGADIRYIQAFLGHAELDTTKIYLRLVPGRLKEDYDKAMPDIAVGVGS